MKFRFQEHPSFAAGTGHHGGIELGEDFLRSAPGTAKGVWKPRLSVDVGWIASIWLLV
jgi:hypothetical protein